MTGSLLWLAYSLQISVQPTIDLPPGPAAEALARVTGETRPASLPPVPAAAWEDPATWRQWAELLRAEAAARAPDPARRACLALLGLEQRRFDDAWARFAECAAAPEVVAALLPRFLPGASHDSKGGDLPDGTVLSPALPPSTRTPPRGRVERHAMRIEGLKVGSAVLAMKVSVESEGVEVELAHLSGGAAKLSVAIPAHPDFDYSDEYVDWYRQEQKGVPHALAISPGDEPHTLYARFELRPPLWPTLLPDRLPAQLSEGTLWLQTAAPPADRALLEAVAESLSSGPLRLAARLREPGPARDGGEPFTGITVDLSDAALRPRKLAWIAGSVERLALAR